MASRRDDFLATTAHRRPSRVLAYASFTGDLHKRVVEHIGTKDIAQHYGFDGDAWIGPRRPESLPKLDFRKYWEKEELAPGTTINDMGVAMVPSGFYHFWGYISPLRNATALREIEEFPMDDASQYDYSGMAPAVQKARAAGQTAVGWVGHMYESAWQMRGYEQFLIDMVEQPAWAECMLERIFQGNLIKARAAAQAGVDLLRCGDDVASQKALMFTKKSWQKMMLSRWAKLWAEVKAISPNTRIWYHSDGNITDIVGDLIEAGVDILNPVQPECLDLDALHRRYGKRLTFDGTIGTQSTMPWGKPADVRARVKEVITKYGKHGGLIISPTHVLEPEVPLENIDALFAAVKEFGTFA